MFSLLLTREFLNYKRNPMKFYGMIGNSLITVIISGLFFLNTIPSTEDILAIGATSDPEHFTLNLSLEFIQAQGTSFVNITSVIMVGIFSVALACTHSIMQFHSKDPSTIRKLPPKSTRPPPTSSPKSSSKFRLQSSVLFSTLPLASG